MDEQTKAIGRIEVALARLEERLTAHCAFEDSRKARFAPWVSACAAVVASAVAVLALIHR